MMLSYTLAQFITMVEADSPIPGGGSVCAWVAALGTALSRMYQNLSFGRKKYESLSCDEKKSFEANFCRLQSLQEQLLTYIEKDALAYESLLKAYRLSKNTTAETEFRKAAIFQATDLAIESPLTIMKLAVEALSLLNEIVDQGNDKAISDVAVAAILLAAAVEGAALNVLINLGQLDSETREGYKAEIAVLKEQASNYKDSVVIQVEIKLQAK